MVPRSCIPDVVQFEHDLHTEEDFWGWEIDEAYLADVAWQEAVTGKAGNRSGGKRIVEDTIKIYAPASAKQEAGVCSMVLCEFYQLRFSLRLVR